MVYCLDTNTFVSAWNELYRPTVFVSFWEKLDKLISDEKCVCTERVLKELEKIDDGVLAWAKERRSMFVKTDAMEAAIAAELAKQYTSFTKERLGRKRADAFVIALAESKKYTVVTLENTRGNNKIPDICKDRKVECMTLPDMIENEGWIF